MTNNVVPFGKYKGQPVEAMAADRGYIDWLLAQPWFKDKHQNIYTLIINNFAEPSETPEHNALQVLFLDNEFAKRVVLFHYKEKIYDALWHRENWWSDRGEKTKLDFRVGFEVAGADVYVRWIYEQGSSYWPGVDGAQFKIEIKPSVGDDYPAILRQMNNIQCPGRPILLVGRYIGVGATREQFVDTFARAGIKVVFHEDVVMERDTSITKEMCDKVNEARVLFTRRYSKQELDAELSLAIEDQEQLFSEAIRDGDDEQIRAHGDAMCRGWAAAVAYVEAARQVEREANQERQRQAGRELEERLARWKEDAEIEKAKAVFPDAVVRIREK